MHPTSALGSPATNGLIGRYVQMFKTGMKKLANTTLNFKDKIPLFLLQYWTTPNWKVPSRPISMQTYLYKVGFS